MSQRFDVPLSDAIAEAAVLWMVRLHSGDVSEQERQAFEAWLEQDHRHASAFDRLNGGLRTATDSPWRARSVGPLLSAINAPNGRRQFMRNALGLGALAVSVGLLGRVGGLPMAGELLTGTAERRRWQLDDGSVLQLNARSRVSTRFTDGQRQLRLLQGELILDIVANANQVFRLETAEGIVSGYGGRLMLRQAERLSELTTLEGALSVSPSNGPGALVSPHKRVLFDTAAIVQQGAMNRGDTAWLDGWLEARKKPLATVVEALRSYRPGIIRLEPELAQLPVSGLYPLDNSDQTLEMLERQLPIRIHRYSPYWISIGRA